MKNKILALLATIGLASSVSAVEINDNLSINGFIDGSYVNTNSNADSEIFGLDEVEVDFLFNNGSVSGAVHVDTEDGDNDVNLDIEQAHVTYSMDNGVSFTFGRYGSALGFEREDPAGLYTYSRAYEGSNNYDLGNVDASIAEGLKIAFTGDAFSIAASIQESNDRNLQTDNFDLELSFAYTGMENLAVGGGYFFDNEKGSADERDVLNLHAAYSIGKALIAAELTNASDTRATAGEDAYLLLLDYDFTDKLGGAIRYSAYEESVSAAGVTRNATKFTIAPNYAITDNLGVIAEYSKVDLDSDPATPTVSADYDYLAVELTYTF
jgi:predicted porin